MNLSNSVLKTTMFALGKFIGAGLVHVNDHSVYKIIKRYYPGSKATPGGGKLPVTNNIKPLLPKRGNNSTIIAVNPNEGSSEIPLQNKFLSNKDAITFRSVIPQNISHLVEYNKPKLQHTFSEHTKPTSFPTDQEKNNLPIISSQTHNPNISVVSSQVSEPKPSNQFTTPCQNLGILHAATANIQTSSLHKNLNATPKELIASSTTPIVKVEENNTIPVSPISGASGEIIIPEIATFSDNSDISSILTSAPALPCPRLIQDPSSVNDKNQIVTAPKENAIDFKNEIQQETPEKEQRSDEIRVKLNALREYGLVDENEETLTTKGNQLYSPKEVARKIKINIPEKLSTEDLTNQDSPFSFGILKVSKIEETLVLQGIHTHITVLYKTFNDQRIVWAYLTSAKMEGSIELSKDQPFNYDSDKKQKSQMLCVLKEPFIVALNDITPMPILNTINQQIIGENYLQRDDVKKRVQYTFNNSVIPIIKKNETMLSVYKGSGVTLEDSDKLLQACKDKTTKETNEYFSKYKKNKHQMNPEKLQDWLNNINKKDAKIYEKLQELIKEYENKFK